MPKPKKEQATAQFNFRVQPSRLKVYKRAAGKITLSAWILDQCDKAAAK